MTDVSQVKRLADPSHIPAWMNGDGEVAERLRKTYARIRDNCRANIQIEAEKTAALEWCRANNNPHQQVSS